MNSHVSSTAQRVRAAARASVLYKPYVRWKYRWSTRARTSYFTGMYEQNVWGDPASRSGSGSNPATTANLRAELPMFLTQLDVKSLLDLPCGDWAWMQFVDLSALDLYVGGDVVPAIIEGVRLEHGGPGREFMVIDALSDRLPAVDAVMVRDLLGHLDVPQVRRLLQNVRRSGATWLLATHYPELPANLHGDMGGWRPQNLTLPPYSWPPPHAILWERPGVEIERSDKTLAAWRIDAL